MNKIILLLALLYITSCVGFPLSNPTEDDIAGAWVSSGVVPYAILDCRAGEGSVLVMAGADEVVEVLAINKISYVENGVVIGGSTQEGETIEFFGTFWGNKLALSEEGDEEFSIWFTRVEHAKKARFHAEAAVNGFFLENQ